MNHSWIQSTKMRWGMALGASLGIGNGIVQVLRDYLSPIAALFGGLAVLAILVIGFYILLTSSAQKAAKDR